MSGKFDADRLFRDAVAVAALVPASQVFRLLARTITLPSGWAVMVFDSHGGQRVYAPGAVVAREEADDVLFVRATPLDLPLTHAALVSQDKYQCTATVEVRVSLIQERGELVSFRDRVLAGNRFVGVDTLVRLLQDCVREPLVEAAGSSSATALVDGQDREAWSRAVRDALEPVCFEAGLAMEAPPAVRFDSPTYRQVRVTEEQAVRRRAEHQARRQLEQAIETAQAEHLSHLESMLARLKQAADASPDVKLPDLMRTFSQSERGELYEALFAAEPASVSTRWIVVATAGGLLFFDPQSPGEVARAVNVSGGIGGIRSVQCLRAPDGTARLLAGAATGVYEFAPEGPEPSVVFRAGGAREVRGGFNGVALAGEAVWASHSELGLCRWQRASPGASENALEAFTRGARAIRDVKFHDGRIYCTVDDRVASIPADDPTAEPVWYTGSGAVLTALEIGSAGVVAGNAEGQILHWAGENRSVPQVLHAGSRRAAESVHLLGTGGVERLFFADTSLAISARVLGDTFVCRYEAGGQTLRRVEVAPDWLVAMNDVRDRLICWSPTKPAQPASVIPFARLTRHSVQDVCLVPAA